MISTINIILGYNRKYVRKIFAKPTNYLLRCSLPSCKLQGIEL